MTSKPIAWTDDAYDRDYSSDGISRFGAYVRQRAHLFIDDWEPLSPATFAATVWTIATAPVMSPPYVGLRHDVCDVICHVGEDGDCLLAQLEVRLPWPNGLRGNGKLAAWSSWRPADKWDYDGPHLMEPAEDRPALLASAVLRLPIPDAQLPAPCRFAALDVAVAKRAVAVVCEHLNTHAAPVLAELATASQIGVGR